MTWGKSLLRRSYEIPSHWIATIDWWSPLGSSLYHLNQLFITKSINSFNGGHTLHGRLVVCSYCHWFFRSILIITRSAANLRSPLGLITATIRIFTASWEDLPQLCFINILELSYFRLQYLVSILTNEQKKGEVTLSVRYGALGLSLTMTFTEIIQLVVCTFFLSTIGRENSEKKHSKKTVWDSQVLLQITTRNTFSKSM